VTLVVHEDKRLGRGRELAALPNSRRPALSVWSSSPTNCRDRTIRRAGCSPCSRLCPGERERDRTLDGHEPDHYRGKTIGGAGVTAPDMLSVALLLREQGVSLRDASKVVLGHEV
jgi:hypothetical protein